MKKKIFIGSDHAGFQVKEKIKKILGGLDYNYEDLGPFDENPVDYPDYAKKVSKKVLENKSSFGILICGSGAGMQIAANKIKGIRAVFSYDEYSSKMARYDNNANILTLRAREFPQRRYKKIVETFLETKFSNFARHKRRIEKLE